LVFFQKMCNSAPYRITVKTLKNENFCQWRGKSSTQKMERVAKIDNSNPVSIHVYPL